MHRDRWPLPAAGAVAHGRAPHGGLSRLAAVPAVAGTPGTVFCGAARGRALPGREQGRSAMIRYLKSGQTAEATAGKQAEVRKTVEAILENIAGKGEQAVREYSQKFDNWSPASFRLSEQQIEGCLATVPEPVKRDIEFAQTQIRNFALAQKSALRDVEVQ